MAYWGLKHNYISSAKYLLLTQWATNTAKTVGQIVRPLATPNVENEYAFMCVVAGTTHATTEPTWSTTSVARGQAYTDNTVTWIECTGQPAVNGDMTNTPNWLSVKNQSLDRGMIIKDAAGTHLFIVSSNGGNTGNGAEPTWNTAAVGNTTADNGVTWTYIGTGFSNWQCPHYRVRNCTQHASQSYVSQYYVGKLHAITYTSTTVTWNTGAATAVPGSLGSQAGPICMYCVDEAGSVPPVTADLINGGSGAKETITANTISLNMYAVRHCYGVEVELVSSGGSFNINLGANSGDTFWENCKFTMGTGMTGGASFQLNTGSNQGTVHVKGCTFKFNNAAQSINCGSRVLMENCVFDTSVAVPNSLFIMQGAGLLGLTVVGSDLSAAFANDIFHANNFTFQADFIDCKLPASPKYANSNFMTNIFDNAAGRVNFIRCDDGTATFKTAAFDCNGSMTTSTSIYRDTGATDGTTPYSWKLRTSVQCLAPSQAFKMPPIGSDVPSGSSKSVTVYGIMNSAAMPTNAEVYADVHYLGTSGNPTGKIKSSRVANYLTSTSPTNLNADTSNWSNGGTARQNSHAYSLNDEIVVASNPGRVFFCTQAGTSNGTEPAGYATAVDGGSVTDSGAVFRAGWRFSFSVNVTSPDPQIAGYGYVHVYVGKISVTCYIDPEVPFV